VESGLLDWEKLNRDDKMAGSKRGGNETE
jgi:hypothetical protein